MAKTNTPFLSMGAQGSIGKSITAQKRAGITLIRQKPLPTDPYSLAQAYQRWLYQDYAHLWTLQTEAIRRACSATGSRLHLTGFQYWMKYQLGTLPDIVGWWKCDINTQPTTPDSSPYGHTATVIGASPATGLIDQCFHFDSLNDMLNALKPATLNIPTGSAECFFYLHSIASSQILISKNQPGVNLGDWFLVFHGVTKLIQLNLTTAVAGFNITSDNQMVALRWYHILVLFGVGGMRMYLDGILQASTNAYEGGMTNNAIDLTIGGSAAGQYLLGKIDNVILLNRRPDLTTIQRHSQRRYPPQ